MHTCTHDTHKLLILIYLLRVLILLSLKALFLVFLGVPISDSGSSLTSEDKEFILDRNVRRFSLVVGLSMALIPRFLVFAICVLPVSFTGESGEDSFCFDLFRVLRRSGESSNAASM